MRDLNLLRFTRRLLDMLLSCAPNLHIEFPFFVFCFSAPLISERDRLLGGIVLNDTQSLDGCESHRPSGAHSHPVAVGHQGDDRGPLISFICCLPLPPRTEFSTLKPRVALSF